MGEREDLPFEGVTMIDSSAVGNGGDGLRSNGIPIRIEGQFEALNNGGDGLNIRGSLEGAGTIRAIGNAGNGVVVTRADNTHGPSRYSSRSGWTRSSDGKFPKR